MWFCAELTGGSEDMSGLHPFLSADLDGGDVILNVHKSKPK